MHLRRSYAVSASRMIVWQDAAEKVDVEVNVEAI